MVLFQNMLLVRRSRSFLRLTEVKTGIRTDVKSFWTENQSMRWNFFSLKVPQKYTVWQRSPGKIGNYRVGNYRVTTVVFFHFFKNQEYSENKIFSEVIDPSEYEYEH